MVIERKEIADLSQMRSCLTVDLTDRQMMVLLSVLTEEC